MSHHPADTPSTIWKVEKQRLQMCVPEGRGTDLEEGPGLRRGRGVAAQGALQGAARRPTAGPAVWPSCRRPVSRTAGDGHKALAAPGLA